MKKKTKNLVLSIAVTLILLLTFTVTYAVFGYMQTGTNNQQLILGDIYMYYNETNELKLENAMPGDDYSEYFEFQVSGKNTYTKQDIYYEITLSKGDLIEDKTESNRIPDEYLKFRLVEVNDDNSETIIINDKTYSVLTNKRIWVETISKNTINEYTKTYRLYMVINDNLIIGNTTDAMYTSGEWKDVFASIKVNVTGDFQEKELAYEDKYNVTDASCFAVEEIITYTHNTNMTDEELAVCLSWNFIGDDSIFDEGSDAESFCQGTGKFNGYTFQEMLDDGLPEEDLTFLKENNIIIGTNGLSITSYDKTCGTDVVIPKTINGNTIITIGEKSFDYTQLTNIVIPDSVTYIREDAFSGNKFTNVVIPDSVTYIGKSAFGYGDLTNVIIPDSVKYIGERAFTYNELTHIRIPDGVTTIEESAFSENDLESVIIPNSVTYIGDSAFSWNQLTKITIPDSVITIGNKAFVGNELTHVTIPDSVRVIGKTAFGYNHLETVTLGIDVEFIDQGAFITHDPDYGGNNYITKIINKSNRAFDWNSVLGLLYVVEEENTFVTGTIKFKDYYNVDQEILITAE